MSGRRRGGASGVDLLAPLIMACSLLAACGGDATGPPEYVLEIFDGDAQTGMGGWELEQPVAVVVKDASGAVVPDVQVRFEAHGADALAWPVVDHADAAGVAFSRWTLGLAGPGPQTLTASVGGASVTFQATALDAEEGDVLVVHDALGAIRGVVVSGPDGTYSSAMGRLTSDTLIALPQLDGQGREVVVFGYENRPFATTPSWTAGRDTVHADLEPPVEVDLAFEIRDGDFDELVAELERQSEVMEGVWRREAVGARLGEISFADSTGSGPVDLSTAGLCPSVLADRIRVSVVTSLDNGTYWGWGCTTGYVFLAGPYMGRQTALYLLAHEVGHTFSLGHTATGLMRPNGPQSYLRIGQVFIATFSRFSALNSIFGGQPDALTRSCFSGDACLWPGYDFPGRVIN